MNKKLSLMMVALALAGCGGNGTDSIGSATLAPMVKAATPATAGTASTVNAAAAVDSSQFLMDAYRDGLSEIQLSQLALQKSANDRVKRFAQRMVDDHTLMNSEISLLAQSKGISLPSGLSADQQAQADKLSSLSGEEFDRAYMAANGDTHDKDVAAARQQAQQGTDPDVRQLADASLPILQLHLAVAEEINSLLDPAAFLVAAYRDGLAEIALSQVAVQKSADDLVRRFAQRMIDDHTEANKRIATLAQQKGISLPNSPTAEQQSEADELSKFSGADFDKTYMDKNVITHFKDVRQARQQASRGSDPDVNSLAQRALPVLVEHLAAAVVIDRRIQPSFLYSAFQDGKAEIQLAHLAVLQGSNSQVKDFAQQMITDHSAANDKIRQLAQQKNLALPTETSPQQLRDFINLMGKSGVAFDKRYIDVNVRNHRTDVDEATEQSRNATDPDIKALAQSLLPTLTAHLNRATEIQGILSTGPAQ